MGNALRFLRRCFESQPAAPPPAPAQPQGSLSVSALARDLFHFEISSQVPDGLSQYVVSSKKAQSKWYGKLLVAWKEARPPPWTEEDAARLVVQALKGHRKVDVEGLLSYYGLPIPEPVPESGKVELHTLPVEYKDVGDGDTINVYVSATTPRESAAIPMEVSRAAAERSQARAARDFPRADALLKTIQTAGYRVNDGHVCGSALEKKYRIRLRGIDAPEMAMPYGKEAKEALAKMVHGKSLRVILYEEDRYGRHVGDVYCDGIFAQEAMLRLGFAWHYVAYDKRPELAMWEKEARSARRGLWASRNPEKPWEWRREKRNGG